MARAIDAEYVEKIFEAWLDALPDGEETPAIEACLAAVRNAPTLTPPNEPLTLEQLRAMDGEPVWVASPNALRYGRWGIVDGVYQAEDDQVLMLRGDYSCHYYGKTWLAYRRPPKEELKDDSTTD